MHSPIFDMPLGGLRPETAFVFFSNVEFVGLGLVDFFGLGKFVLWSWILDPFELGFGNVLWSDVGRRLIVELKWLFISVYVYVRYPRTDLLE